MTNHVHRIATPQTVDGLALAFKHIHGRFATGWDAIVQRLLEQP